MIEWIDSHGFIVLGAYMLVCLVAGTIPPLPANATFWEQWGYMVIKAAALNSRALGNAMGVKMPELQIPSLKRAADVAAAELPSYEKAPDGPAKKEP